jgi:hypothetical protein
MDSERAGWRHFAEAICEHPLSVRPPEATMMAKTYGVRPSGVRPVELADS